MRKLVLGGLATLCCAAFLGVTAGAALAAAPEEPVTKAATEVKATEATLNGELNPHTTSEVGYYYAYNTNGTCTEGSTTEAAAEESVNAKQVPTKVTGLVPSSNYTFCLVATSLGEPTFGAAQTFKTEALEPTIESVGASGQTPFAATIEAQVNPENQPTTFCQFEYGKGSPTGTTAECEPASLEGFGGQRVSANLSGLEPATKYQFKLTVKNATGETKNETGEFETTSGEPIIDSQSVSGLSATGATLNAVINPNYQETTYSFEYATTEGLTGATILDGPSPLPAEFGEFGVGLPTGTLQPRTTYYFRVVANNGTGPAQDLPVEKFTTLATPAVTVNEAEEITRTTATLSGTVNPAGAETTYHFAYIDLEGFEAGLEKTPEDPFTLAKTTPSVSAGSTYTVQDAGPTTVRELTPGTTYIYAIAATNSLGTTIEPIGVFTTAAPTPPAASTGGSSGVTQLSASISGSVDTQGLQTNVQFEFGTVEREGSLIPPTTESGEGSVLQVSASFTNDLQPGTTYYYRTVATSQDGTSYGAEESFTTGTFPSPFATFTTPALLPAPPAEFKPPPPPPPGHETNAQKLAKALKECKKKAKKKRPSCERQARKKYGPKPKKKSKKKKK